MKMSMLVLVHKLLYFTAGAESGFEHDGGEDKIVPTKAINYNVALLTYRTNLMSIN